MLPQQSVTCDLSTTYNGIQSTSWPTESIAIIPTKSATVTLDLTAAPLVALRTPNTVITSNGTITFLLSSLLKSHFLVLLILVLQVKGCHQFLRFLEPESVVHRLLDITHGSFILCFDNLDCSIEYAMLIFAQIFVVRSEGLELLDPVVKLVILGQRSIDLFFLVVVCVLKR